MRLFPRFNFSIAIIIYLLVILWNVWWTFTWLYHQQLNKLAEEGRFRLELYITYLQGVLEKYENLPELLAHDSTLVTHLTANDSRDKVQFLNNYLQKINEITKSSDIYLLNTQGTTIAASNWNTPISFVGQNFSYRPYFQQALRGQLGRYFAKGTTSDVRGFYFAFPILHQGNILGVLTLKINIDTVENNWGHEDQTFLVTDPDGVVFLATNQEMVFRTLTPLPPDVAAQLQKSRRYSNVDLTPLSIHQAAVLAEGKIVTMRMSKSSKPRKFLLQTRFMEKGNWYVHVMTETSRVERFILLIFLALNFFLLLSGLFFMLMKQRRQRKIDLRRYEENARRLLQEANEQLEERVTGRTTELTQANEQLRREIDERKRAEIALRQTRSELVHAAKMAALGQMSAGINHELNQPLAAIRSYSDNSRLLLEKGRLQDALWNLEQISELTERMAQIGVQLKQFSRKTSGQLEVIPLHSVIDGALEILNPIIRKTDVWIKVVIEPKDLKIQANHVLLQQVVVNLVSNALQAVEKSPKQEIRIRGYQKEGKVVLSVADSGTGIPPEHLPHIFEPFFTSKSGGQGLGHGLPITERILREMNGEIRVSSTDNGAKFDCFLNEADLTT
jgi:two-component system C4-dicarboxylate transport sensor histidine kinase DctB